MKEGERRRHRVLKRRYMQVVSTTSLIKMLCMGHLRGEIAVRHWHSRVKHPGHARMYLQRTV